MSTETIIRLARERTAGDDQRRGERSYCATMALFHFLGLLRHNRIKPERKSVTLDEILAAGELEPRIFELLPAVMLILPEAVCVESKDMPKDLAAVLFAIRKRRRLPKFRGVSAHRYMHWIKSPIMDIARRRLNFRTMPRSRHERTHAIGEVIRRGRSELSLTQKQLAETYDLPLRVIRDLEQGKSDASLKSVEAILKVFGRSLRV